ncbi:transposase, partial [Streptomyces sp. ISL-100]|nr:transposase [Streptomyces sp. ISL-100]
MTTAEVWDLAPGVELMVGGTEWRIESCLPHLGRVTLISDEGAAWKVSLSELMHRPDCRPSSRTRKDLPAASRGRQPKGMEDLEPREREHVMRRLDHIREVESGYRSGDALAALSHEPRPQYDPDSTTLTQRRRAKAAELRRAADDDFERAKALALHQVSFRTLVRWDLQRRRFGPVGLADDRWLREATGHRISAEVREAIFAVRPETLHRSKIGAKARERLIHQYVREVFGPEVEIPGYDTLRTVWREWFGSQGARQRSARSAANVKKHATGRHVVVHRPGQVVALDTTVLPVKVLDSVFGDPVSVHLTLALGRVLER